MQELCFKLSFKDSKALRQKRPSGPEPGNRTQSIFVRGMGRTGAVGKMFLSYTEEDFRPQWTVQNKTKALCGHPPEVLGRVRFPALRGSGPGKLLAGEQLRRLLLAHSQYSPIAKQERSGVMAREQRYLTWAQGSSAAEDRRVEVLET